MKGKTKDPEISTATGAVFGFVGLDTRRADVSERFEHDKDSFVEAAVKDTLAKK